MEVEEVKKVKKPRKCKSRYPIDRQVSKVYNWEFDILELEEELTPEDAKSIIKKIVADHNLKNIKVKIKKPRKNSAWGGFTYGNTEIVLLYTQLRCVIHETAHAMLGQLCKEMTGVTHYRLAHHGPEFVATYVYLLEKYVQLPYKNLLLDLSTCGIRIDMDLMYRLKLKYAPSDK